MDDDLSIDAVLNAYRCGLFPMADSSDSDEFHWYDPQLRGQLPILDLHIPKRLQRTILQSPYKVTIDQDFSGVLRGCAKASDDRPSTWINKGIHDLFVALYNEGYAHSIECWQDEKLVGGLYGLALGGAFMGESMFSSARDSSKVALTHLCARLWKAGFTILDTQFINEHLLQFGVHEIPRDEYLKKLNVANGLDADFCLCDTPGLTEEQLIKDFLKKRHEINVL